MEEVDAVSAYDELRYKLLYIRDWFTWGAFVQNVVTCVLGAYYIGWRMRLLVLKIAQTVETT